VFGIEPWYAFNDLIYIISVLYYQISDDRAHMVTLMDSDDDTLKVIDCNFPLALFHSKVEYLRKMSNFQVYNVLYERLPGVCLVNTNLPSIAV
jgi:hypothetical protein